MDLSAITGTLITDLTSTTTGVPALIVDLVPLLGLFIAVKLFPRLVRKFAR
jgi:hypothetical protein